MPKPRATTELCRRVRAIPRLSLMNGCEKLRPKRIPRVSAIGGENNPVKERTRPRVKKIFARVGIDREKNISREPNGPVCRSFLLCVQHDWQSCRLKTLRCFSA